MQHGQFAHAASSIVLVLLIVTLATMIVRAAFTTPPAMGLRHSEPDLFLSTDPQEAGRFVARLRLCHLQRRQLGGAGPATGARDQRHAGAFRVGMRLTSGVVCEVAKLMAASEV